MMERSTTTYDQYGRAETITDFNGDRITYTYDDTLNLLTGKSKSANNVADITYSYDPVTYRLESVTDGWGTTNFTYDRLGRLAEVTNPNGTINYGYDSNHLTSVTTSSGTTTYIYDELNRIDQVWDSNERLLADYDYNEVGNLVLTTLGNGIVESRGYDELNRLQWIEQSSDGNSIGRYDYELDAVGNRLQVTELGGRVVEYDYDDLYRLTSERITDSESGSRTISYSYDDVGNRLTKNDSVAGETNYVYNANSELESFNDGAGTTRFNYDANGSLIGQFNPDGSQSIYDWVNNGENRLVGITTTSASSAISHAVQYSYDYQGSRVQSVVNGETINYLVDTKRPHAQVLQSKDSTGEVIADYVYGNDLISRVASGVEEFYHGDALGSTRLLTDATGTVSDAYTYDAYGLLLGHEGTSDNSHLYAGEQVDLATGLSYNRARYYNPSKGRFMSQDAFEGVSRVPLSQNPYIYAHDNPMSYTDPSGYFSMGEILVQIKVLAALVTIGTVGSEVARVSSGAFSSKYIYQKEARRIEEQMLPIASTFGTGKFDGGANATAELVQFIANRMNYTKWVWDFGYRTGVLLGVAADMLTDQEENLSQWVFNRLGALGDAGPRSSRNQKWLTGHKDPQLDWKIYFPGEEEGEFDPTIGPSGGITATGRRDHYFAQAWAGSIAGGIYSTIDYLDGGENRNDLKINELGQEFGRNLHLGLIAKHQVDQTFRAHQAI